MNLVSNPGILYRIADQVSDPIFLLNTDFSILFVNKAYSEHMGLAKSAMRLKALGEVIPADYAEILIERFKDIRIDNQSFDNIYHYVQEDGTIIIEKWHNEGVFDESGRLLYYYCIATLKRQYERTFTGDRDSERSQGTASESSKLGIIITSQQKISYIDKNVPGILGLRQDEITEDTNLPELLAITPPSFEKTLKHEIKYKKPGGKNCWLSLVRQPHYNGCSSNTLIIIEDITDRKLSEIETADIRKSLLSVMRYAKIGYWEKDFDNDCWKWSDEVYNIYEIEKGTLITEDLIRAAMSDETIRERESRFSRILAPDSWSIPHRFEYPILTGNGRKKWLAGEAYYENERFYGWTQDITDRKNIEEALRNARDKAEESERLKSAFLANMSHEIRTPLNAILGFSDLLTKTPSASAKLDYNKIIHQSSSLLLKIIDDILDLSIIESGNLSLLAETVNVDDFLDEIDSIYTDHHNDKIKLIIKKNGERLYVSTDRERFKQIFINLINNAFKYTDEGSITVAYKQLDGGIRFSITDTGVGIPEQELEQIFERFYQNNSFSKGTGLGLAISRSIIEQMGGTIDVESIPGEGSVFSFTLPKI